MRQRKEEFLYEELTYKIVGIGMKIHRELGPGFLEAVYEEAMIIELQKAGIIFKNQVELDVYYRGEKLNKKYRADFIIDDKVLVELKGTHGLTETDEAQMINYLKATKLQVGLMLNFGKSSLEWKRIVY
ncbi:MAG: GxxExxY protein [bacterium (Candidatus Stahlbacteria) CG23_combo_of_CG06-09_8_20_14_all_40_9]|nr:MAG: GxxExxY protein [bacterium (Candidatus Stahlbacteria) CG23_combo_of_CG06-09_8_20_14_all_40_9]